MQASISTVARSLDAQLGKGRSLVLPDRAMVTAVPPGDKVGHHVAIEHDRSTDG
jgi:hypothetical protein